MSRIIKIAFKIFHHPGTFTRPSLAKMLHVNKGTIQRDIDLLRDMGLVIRVEGKQGYVIESGFEEVFLADIEINTSSEK